MGVYREEFSFGVEVALRGHLEGASADSEGLVLDSLEFEDAGRRGVGEPDGSGVGENRTDEGAEGGEHGLLLETPGGAS